jgi:lipopolysaccharide assembly protein B
MINFWPLLLPAAAFSGWWAARRNDVVKNDKHNNKLSHEYIVGLNYLLNEQPDKAVDIFIKLLDVDSDTVETHLALGSLFRRRGEVDRAIRIHQNLIARPQLSQAERVDALMALGEDYMSAGVIDRAERIFLEVAELGGDKQEGSLKGLLAIYQQEKSWEKALDSLQKLEVVSGKSMRTTAAHYYCELVEQAMKDNQVERANYYLKQALSIDKYSVRASILMGNLEKSMRRYKQAIKSYKRVLYQDPEFLPEIVEPIISCFHALGSLEQGIEFLKETLQEHPRSSAIFVIAQYIMKEDGNEEAVDFVAEQLARHPSIRGLNRLIYWHVETAYGKVREKLQMLYDITRKFLENKPIYRCGDCGYGGKHLHWQCPSCKKWSTTKPIHGLEGD